MTQKQMLWEILTNNWKAKLGSLLVGFLIWFAVKNLLNPDPDVDQDRLLLKERATQVESSDAKPVMEVASRQ